MKKIFSILFVFVFLFCACGTEHIEEPIDERPLLYYKGTYWKNPYAPVNKLPDGYEYAGKIDEKMSYNTGIIDVEYYTNPETNDFYTYQMTGTFIGNNTVDATKQAMHYIQWIPIDEE